jgi:hypothetical protein
MLSNVTEMSNNVVECWKMLLKCWPKCCEMLTYNVMECEQKCW